MAENLSDDPRDWPTDPFRLLGVEYPATDQDLRRAYAKLIKRFKPEHHPEQFRIIREAYEAALQRARWFRDIPSEEVTIERIEIDTSEPRTVSEPSDPGPEVVSTNPTKEAWDLAQKGELAAAYSRLLEMASARPTDSEVSLRLYWLLALDPELDPDRSRHDWLSSALTQSRLTGGALELYRRELHAVPETALFGPYSRLLEIEDASSGSVLHLASERLVAAGLGKWWAKLDNDLWTLAERQNQFDEGQWLGYLVRVMGYVALDEPRPVFERCSDLIGSLRHLELANAWAFDQIDEFQTRGLVWRATAGFAAPLREVVRLAWSGPYGAWRKPLAIAGSWVVDDPVNVLYELDRAARNANAYPLLVTLGQLLDDQLAQDRASYPPELIRGQMRSFLKAEWRKDYQLIRPALVRFLIAEAIDPAELVRAGAEDRSISWSLMNLIREDSILHLVCRTAAAHIAG